MYNNNELNSNKIFYGFLAGFTAAAGLFVWFISTTT